jgi:hypothetical protein
VTFFEYVVWLYLGMSAVQAEAASNELPIWEMMFADVRALGCCPKSNDTMSAHRFRSFAGDAGPGKQEFDQKIVCRENSCSCI